jgi:chromosome segregation ATPase
MLKMKRTMAALVVPTVAALLFGCGQQNRRSGTANSQDQGPNGSNSAAKRFQDTPLEGKTVVESAMELSEKYASLSDQANAMRQENQRLAAENEDMKRQIAAAETKLKQTQKELGEANQLLIEMLTELNNWKTNILGFRGEMREAQKAQLEALLKVLEILGGEAEAGVVKQQHATTLRPDRASPEPNGLLTSKGKDQNEP